MSVNAIPEGFHSLTPYLIIKDAAKAIDFYKRAFGAEEGLKLEGPGGMIAHAELKVGNSHLMMTEENAECEFRGPATLGGTTVSLCLYVEDVDQVFANAIAEGATEMRPVMDQFYGDRAGTLQDPFGHVWTVATHKEDLTTEEINQRMVEFMSNEQE